MIFNQRYFCGYVFGGFWSMSNFWRSLFAKPVLPKSWKSTILFFIHYSDTCQHYHWHTSRVPGPLHCYCRSIPLEVDLCNHEMGFYVVYVSFGPVYKHGSAENLTPHCRPFFSVNSSLTPILRLHKALLAMMQDLNRLPCLSTTVGPQSA